MERFSYIKVMGIDGKGVGVYVGFSVYVGFRDFLMFWMDLLVVLGLEGVLLEERVVRGFWDEVMRG